jgi:formylglycine-generating enzyme required for sulfatase activity
MFAKDRVIKYTALLYIVAVFSTCPQATHAAPQSGLLSNSRPFASEQDFVLVKGERTKKEPAPATALEIRFWNGIKNSESADDFQTYLDAYPDGKFVEAARSRLQQIQTKRTPPPPHPSSPDTAPTPSAGEPSRSPTALRDCSQCPQLVLLPAGEFRMGSTEMFPFEGPVHSVRISKPLYIGEREVTFGEWDACVAEGGCAYSPPHHGSVRETLPATNLDWNDAHQYVAWLSKKTGKTYRLASESEWEYAARAGGTASFPWGASVEKNRANCGDCSDQPPRDSVPVGSFPPNGFGLFDMAGNAAEWVEDCWNDSYKGAPADGSAWVKPRCQERVLRGGSYNNDSRYLRSASRFKYDFDVRYHANGFRVVREY